VVISLVGQSYDVPSSAHTGAVKENDIICVGPAMVILFAHNYYRQQGGEDAGVRQERDLMAARGHRVVEYSRDNAEIKGSRLATQITLGAGTIWSRRSYNEIRALIHRERPEVAYFHNVVPLISPSAYYACHRAGVPVVQTLHNYRLFCPAGQFYREGRICEECVQHGVLRSVQHRCYRGSAAATASIAGMLVVHRWLKTWARQVDGFIVRTEFARRWFVAAGLCPEKVAVKACFVEPDPGLRSGRREAALFVGRLSAEKGLPTLLRAWRHLGSKLPLKIVGDGPLRQQIEKEIDGRCGIELLGWLEASSVYEEMKRAKFLVLPSEWYEGLPLTIVQAFACGLPVVASRLGSMSEIVDHGKTGLHFKAGDEKELADAVEWASTHPAEMETMGRNARTEYEAKYTAQRNYDALMRISKQVIRARKQASA
jgi:glycosyltransferase involved in cell wall biosynthesis